MRLVGFVKYIAVVCFAILMIANTAFSMNVSCKLETGSFDKNRIEFQASEFSEKIRSTSLIITDINWSEKLFPQVSKNFNKGGVTYLKNGILVAIACHRNKCGKPARFRCDKSVSEIKAYLTNIDEQPITQPTQIANEQKAKLDAIYSATSSSVSMTNTATEQTVRLSASASRWQNANSPQEAQAFANDIQASIVMFMAIAEVIEKQPPTLKDRVLGIVTSEIKRLQSEKELLQAQLTNRFSTPIRPTNANLSVSAFRAADTFPKIPFYVPGTNEIGEMLVVPRITDEGYLQYQFDFLDPTATYDKVRDSISIEHKNVDLMIGGLQKVDEWTLVAQENGVTRRVEKTSACIPDGACENKVQGVSSTEVVFQIYEDGSTAGRIQRNKGQFSTGYNMSVESSILLSAYLTYMRDVGSKEFNIGVMSDDEVKDLFQ